MGQRPTVLLLTRQPEADLVVMSVEAYQKMMARQRLGQMLGKVDREIAAGTPMRNFEDIFSDVEDRIEQV